MILTFLLLPPLLPFPAPGRCFRTWVLITYQLFYLSPFLRSIAPTSVTLPSIFRKLAGMTLPLYFDSHCPSAGEYSSFSLSSAAALFTSLALNSATSNALPKPGGLLRWKERLVKDARLSLLFTEVMKIARLTSLLLGLSSQSSPRLRHGRRLALFSHRNLTLNLYTFSFALSLALFLPPVLISLTVLIPGSLLRFTPLT